MQPVTTPETAVSPATALTVDEILAYFDEQYERYCKDWDRTHDDVIRHDWVVWAYGDYYETVHDASMYGNGG